MEKRNQPLVAWVFMMTAIGLHVFDETLTDFLPLYNRVVLQLRERIGFFPAPTFTFPVWLGGLIFLVLIGFAATPLIKKGSRWARVFAAVLGILMILNAANHIFWSIYFQKLMPGFWSSPLLFLAALFMVVQGVNKSNWKKP